MESSRKAEGHLKGFKKIPFYLKRFVAMTAIFIGTVLTIVGAVNISIGLEVLNSSQCSLAPTSCPSPYGSQMGGGLDLAIGLGLIATIVSPFLYSVLKSPTEKTSETKQNDSVKPAVAKEENIDGKTLRK